MNVISYVMAFFSVLGAVDLIFGDKLGVGTQFKRGVELLGTMAMSMVGMIVIAPLISKLVFPSLDFLARIIPFDPAVVAGSFLANDMGGAPLSMEFAKSTESGYFNGLIVASMMGATISFTLPFSLGAVAKGKQESLFLGLLCGIVTVPIGCFMGGLVSGLSLIALAQSIIPLSLFAGILAFGLLKIPKICVKIFKVFAVGINVLILVGLSAGIFEGITGIEVIPYTAPIEEGFDVIFSASMIMSGAFPFVYILSKILDKPMRKLGQLFGISSVSAVGFLSTLATNVTTLGNMKYMDEKGVVLNSAFSVSASFVFAGHLAFTLANNPDYTAGMIVAKLVGGITAVMLALWIYKRVKKNAPAPVALLG